LLGALVLTAAVGACLGPVARASVFRVSEAVKGRPIPADFLGLALEYRSIPVLVGPDPKSIDPVLVQLIRNLVAQGRPVLRIGGQSTDRTWWPVRGMSQPLGVTYSLTPSWMSSAQALAQATNARLILGLNLEANRPKIDAVEASQLISGIGRRYIDALEIGNEPELYTTVPWYRRFHGAPIAWYRHDGVPVFARSPRYAPATFFGEFSRTLQVLPHLPVAGPVTGSLSWLGGFDQFLAPSSRVRLVTWHAYGLNQCVTDPSSPQYPSVSNLLAPAASRGIVNGLSPYVEQAHRVGASFRVDEMNSVTCNGRPGVSDTFASALWAMDALFTIASDGVDGVNIHTYENAANGLFDFNRSHGQWTGAVHPLYYGLLLFAQAAPPGSRLLRIDSGNQDGVRVWATLAPDHRIRVLMINDNLARSARAVVRAPVASGPAAIDRLRARSAYAKDGITLGGESFGSGTGTGVLPAPQLQSVMPGSGGYAVTLPAASAALLTLPPGS
jgi:hypothetical protein